jgi:hypothetical protein
MISKTLTFEDFSDPPKTVTEKHWFNMTRQQVIEWEAQTGEGVLEYFTRISQSGDKKKLYDAFEDFLLRCYGIRSEDGSKHAKSPEISQAFKDSAAYDEFFMSFIENQDTMVEFLKGVLPKQWLTEEAKADMDIVAQIPQERFDAVQKSVMPPPPPMSNEAIARGQRIANDAGM